MTRVDILVVKNNVEFTLNLLTPRSLVVNSRLFSLRGAAMTALIVSGLASIWIVAARYGARM
jgi:hypothetical protein